MFEKLCADSGMASPDTMGTVCWNDSVELLNDYSSSLTNVSGEHYIPNSRSYYAEGSRFKKYHVAIDMYESDNTTIMQGENHVSCMPFTSSDTLRKELFAKQTNSDP